MALITALFLMVLMTILGLTMVFTASSDMMINGYYGNSRAAYFAADSGVNVARQYLFNNLLPDVNYQSCLGWGPGSPIPNPNSLCNVVPLLTTPATAAANALASFKTAYGGGWTSLGTPAGSSANPWPNFYLQQDSGSCQTSFVAAPGYPQTQAGNIPYTASPTHFITLINYYQYAFNYTICMTGTGSGGLSGSTSSASQKTTIKESGTIFLTLTVAPGPAPYFSGYGQYVQNQPICPGSYLTPGTYTGPMYTNQAWTLGPGNYTFTAPLQSTGANIGYYTGGGCVQSTSATPPNGSGINPNFQGGLQLGVPAVTPPADSYSQKAAVVDGLGLSSNLSAMTTYLKNVNGTPYVGPSSTGVFLPYTGSTYGGVGGVGGGIYVEGNASVVLSPGTDGSGNKTQVFTITQGGTVTTVTINRGLQNPSATTANTTTIASGGTTTHLTGVPTDPANPLLPTQATSVELYVEGNITGLSGPGGASGEGQTAIQDNYMVSVVAGATSPTATANINITGDLRYSTEPVPLSTNNVLNTSFPQSPQQSTTCTACYQTLGVFTANGAIILSSPYADGNLETDGALAALGQNCTSSTCGFQVSGHINTWNNVGGQIQANQFVCNLTTANTWYDQRFSQWTALGFSPPFFPATSTTGNSSPQAPKVQPTNAARLTWAWQDLANK